MAELIRVEGDRRNLHTPNLTRSEAAEYIFEPKEDLTPRELAIILMGSLPQLREILCDEAVFATEMPEEMKRHWRLRDA